MSKNLKTMQYLSVNAEDYLHPPMHQHHRHISRSVSPGLEATDSLDDEYESNHKLRKTASTKSLLQLHKFTSSESNLSTSGSTANSNRKAFYYKSSENLCFGLPRKHLRRQSQIDEVYRPRPRCNTDPMDGGDRCEKAEQQPNNNDSNKPMVPIINLPETESHSACSSMANSAIPTPVLGRKQHHIQQHQRRPSALSSLIEQALKVTTASVGLKGKTEERSPTQQQQQVINSPNDENVKRSPPSVSTFSTTPNAESSSSTSMAPLHHKHTGTQSVTTLNLYEKDTSPIGGGNCKVHTTQQQQQYTQPKKQHHTHKRQSSNQSEYYTKAYSQATTTTPEKRRSLNSLVQCESTSSIRSLSPTSRKSTTTNSSWSGGPNTAKHEPSSAATTAAATAAAAVAAATAVPIEKEKKRKEVSSSRVKKFHRHFTQVPKDEKLINYFSCALVSDILLQGHLYITDQHFAFYSNVFGYVTKVVIPTSSVTKISKEKTAKIIPNAVGVATADERHVFGSFISREAAFRLMCSVCPPLAPAETLLPKAAADIEISEEYSIEDDSSCSISGNESPPHLLAATAAAAVSGGSDELSQTLIHRNVTSGGGLSEAQRHSDIPLDAKQSRAYASAPSVSTATSCHQSSNGSATGDKICIADGGVTPACLPLDGITANATGIALIVAGTASSSTTSGASTPTQSTISSLPTTVMAGGGSGGGGATKSAKTAAHAALSSFRLLTQKALLRLKFPTELHVVYLGVLLTALLALFSLFLLYRILDIEAKTGDAYRRNAVEFNWRSGSDDDIFAEALRWQREFQAKSTEEAQNILTQNLQQIAKVRRSLETLSMLIHDRSSSAHSVNGDDSD